MSRSVIVAVDTADLERAVAFYRDAIDARVVEDRRPEFVMVALGDGVALCLDRAENATPMPAPRIILPVDDLARVEERLRVRGIPIHGRAGPRTSRWISALDPDGREVIFQEQAK